MKKYHVPHYFSFYNKKTMVNLSSFIVPRFNQTLNNILYSSLITPTFVKDKKYDNEYIVYKIDTICSEEFIKIKIVDNREIVEIDYNLAFSKINKLKNIPIALVEPSAPIVSNIEVPIATLLEK